MASSLLLVQRSNPIRPRPHGWRPVPQIPRNPRAVPRHPLFVDRAFDGFRGRGGSDGTARSPLLARRSRGIPTSPVGRRLGAFRVGRPVPLVSRQHGQGVPPGSPCRVRMSCPTRWRQAPEGRWNPSRPALGGRDPGGTWLEAVKGDPSGTWSEVPGMRGRTSGKGWVLGCRIARARCDVGRAGYCVCPFDAWLGSWRRPVRRRLSRRRPAWGCPVRPDPAAVSPVRRRAVCGRPAIFATVAGGGGGVAPIEVGALAVAACFPTGPRFASRERPRLVEPRRPCGGGRRGRGSVRGEGAGRGVGRWARPVVADIASFIAWCRRGSVPVR